MKLIRKATLTTGLLIAAATVGTAAPAQAFSLYFGEDLGKGEQVRLNATPNANRARDQFLSNLIGVGTENFERYSVETEAPLSINFGSAGTATLLGNGFIDSVTTGTNGVGRYPISGNKYWEASDVIGINFSKAVAAFGFYGVDIGDFEGQLTLTLLNTLTNFQQTVTVPHTMQGLGGGVIYFGLIAESNEVFDRIVFGNTAPGVDYFSFDNMTVGSLEQVVPTETVPPGGIGGGTSSQPVPEPLSMAGMILGGAMLAGTRKLRQGGQKVVASKG